MRKAKQIAKRAMKFLMASIGESVSETLVTEEYVDCCLQKVTVDWGLSSSAAVNYLKCIADLLDFRKTSGVTDAVLRLICRYRSLFAKRKRQSEQKEKYGV